MRPSIALCLLAACSFTPPSNATDPGVDAPPGPPPVDAREEPQGDAPPPTPDAPPPQVTCTTSDGALSVCLEFEDPVLGTAVDGSGRGHDATVTGATALMRDVPAVSKAIGVAAGTTIRVAETTDLDLPEVTVAAWVQRVGTPSSGQRYGVLDIGTRQTAISIDDQGRAICSVKDDANIWVRSGGTTGSGEWAFIACTFDAPELCTYVFRNGSTTPSVTCGNTDGDPLDTSDTNGMLVGALFSNGNPASRLAGAIDAIRVYGRALTETELCNSAGLTGC